MLKLVKILALCVLVLTSACSKEDAKTETTTNETEKLYISSGENNNEFNVEIADTRDALYQGLMGRASLADNSGMLLDFAIVPQDVVVGMWMKDTLIPLDMIFIDEDGSVFFTYQNAKPNSTEVIYPPKRPRAVLEINAGKTEELGIKNGDIVRNKIFNNI